MFTLIRPLFPYFRRYRRDFFWGGLSIVLSNAIAVLFPLVVAMVIDGLNTGVTKRKILIFSGMLLGVTVGKGIFLFLSRLILIGISRDIEFDLRNDLFTQLEKQPASYYHRNRTGDIMARMTNDLNAVRMLLGPAIMYSANTILFSVGALFFLLRISPFLTLVALVPLPRPASSCRRSDARSTTASSVSRQCSPTSRPTRRKTSPAPASSAPSPRKKRRSPPSTRPIANTSAAAFDSCS